MTKEELEKEVLEYLNTQTLPKIDSLVYRVIKNLIFGFAEPREKRIKHLEESLLDVTKKSVKRIADLEQKLEQTEKDLADYQFNYPTIKELEETINKLREQLALRYSLEDKIKELEQQIEKMKCCKICKHNGIKTCQYDNGIKDCLENGRKLFELKEIKE